MEQTTKRKPFLTTQETDMLAFSTERTLFLTDFVEFRAGNFPHGTLALNHLIAMFYTLPATRYFSTNEIEAIAFLDSIDSLQTELRENPNTADKGRIIIPELIKKMDTVVRSFHKILHDTGYSGG